jgi:alpha-galactosidase
VVSPGRDRALFAYVLTASPAEDPPPRFVLRGLDPDRPYSVRPVLVGSVPSGLVSPLWWGEPRVRPPEQGPGEAPRAIPTASAWPGTVLTGAALMAAGLVPPRLHPDQAVLHLLEAV